MVAKEGETSRAPEELIYGRHAVAAALARGARDVIGFWVQENRRDARSRALLDKAESAGIAVHPVPRKTLDDMVPGARHQGFVIRCTGVRPEWGLGLTHLLETIAGPALLLVLDSVQDPHNLGACLRNADGAGVHAVVAPRNRSAGLTAAVRKVASGAAESVPFVSVVNLARSLDELRDRGIQVLGAAGDARVAVYDVDLTGPIAFVLGGEARGLRRLTRERCDRLVRIPMHGSVQSLNVSVASGICLYEACRQRRQSR